MRLTPATAHHSPRERTRAASRMIVVAPALLLLAACTGTTPEPSPDPDPTPEPTPEPTADPITAADIHDWAEDTEWRWSDDGLAVPINLAFVNGESTDPSGRSYVLGAGVEGDANGDGIVDVAIPALQTDGDESQELWYVWLGRSGDGAPAEQVIYPIARTENCGDITNSVTAVDSAFQIDQTLKMPYVDDNRSCDQGGTGEQVREVTISEIDGGWYPVQTAPALAWGGICPRSEQLDGDFAAESAGRVAPPESSQLVQPAGEVVSLFELEESPLMSPDGDHFFGFVPGQGEPDAVAGLGDVYQQCAFFE